jgi:hypothetical protein
LAMPVNVPPNKVALAKATLSNIAAPLNVAR